MPSRILTHPRPKTISSHQTPTRIQVSRQTGLLLVVLAGLISCGTLGTGITPVTTPTSFTVNTTLDSIDAKPADGICADSSGKCSLRAAVMEANATKSAQTINLGTGTYTLTLAGSNEDAALTGDLDVSSEIGIVGIDAASTIIDANNLDRAIDIPKTINDTTSNLTLTKLTIRNGSASDGGCLRIGNTFAVVKNKAVLSDSILENCKATGNGGAIMAENFLTASNLTVKTSIAVGAGGAIFAEVNAVELNNARLDGNRASVGGAITAGLYGSGSLTITNSSFTGNTAQKYGGAIQLNAPAVITNSTFSTNSVVSSSGFGGAISVSGIDLTIQGGTITGNTAAKGGGLGVETGGKSILKNVTLDANTASVAGGALYLTGQYTYQTGATITSSTFTKNVAPTGQGGAVATDYTAVALITSSTLKSLSGGECANLNIPATPAFTSGGGNTVKDASCSFSAAGDIQNAP
jgi:large repetitive protein